MSGDVVTTVKEYQWLISLTLRVLAAYFGSGWARRGIGWTFAVSRTRKLRRLRERQAWLQQLYDSDREYYGWLLSGMLWVLMLFGMLLMFEPVMVPHLYHSTLEQRLAGGLEILGRNTVGLLAYYIAGDRVGGYRALQHFDQTMARLDKAIATLEAKQALRQPPVEAHVG